MLPQLLAQLSTGFANVLTSHQKLFELWGQRQAKGQLLLSVLTVECFLVTSQFSALRIAV